MLPKQQHNINTAIITIKLIFHINNKNNNINSIKTPESCDQAYLVDGLAARCKCTSRTVDKKFVFLNANVSTAAT